MKEPTAPLRLGGGKIPRIAAAIALSAALGASCVGAPTAAYALTGFDDGTKSIDTSSHYTATGIEESNLRYAQTTFDKVNDDGSIALTVSKWSTLNVGEWKTDPNDEFAGQYLLMFSNDEFYKQIDTITVSGVSLTKRDDGALWMTEITDKVFDTALIGVVTNHDMVITLKNGQTLDGLGLADTPISFQSLWVKGDGAVAKESINSGYILKNNPDLSDDQIETGFMHGRMGQRVLFDADSMTLRSVHTFKPNENYMQSDYNWVLYVKEQIPAELADYIDKDGVTIQRSEIDGTPDADRTAFKVKLGDDGVFDTSTNAALSIVGNDTKTQLGTARTNTNQVFWGTLGQSRSYTIYYKLKDGVSLADFAQAMNDYIAQNNKRLLFSHWIEADYLNDRDGGAAPKQLKNSYSNAYLDTNDTDKDGLFDFVELQIGTDATKVDTDGDGIPDLQEFADDKTDPANAKSYLPPAASAASKNLDNTKDTLLAGTAPRALVPDPSDASKVLSVTDAAAYPVTVTLHKYHEDTQTYDDAVIAESGVSGGHSVAFDNLAQGDFEINVAKSALDAAGIAEGDKLVLVSHSPQGETTMGAVLTAGPAAQDADAYDPVPAPVETETGTLPDPADGVANKDDLPDDADYSWDNEPDVSKPGDSTGTVKVTYPDGSSDTVDVAVKVTDPAVDPKPDPGTDPDAGTDADQYTAQGGTLEKGYGDTATAAELAAKVTTDAPADKVASIEPIGTIPASGAGLAVPMRVTYADKSTDDVIVTLSYGLAADTFASTGTDVEVEQGAQPDAADGIANKGELPKGTSYEWKQPVDTANPGDTTGTVVVTYPDGSIDEVDVDVHVVAPAVTPSDADLYFAAGGALYKDYGDTATAAELAAKVSTNAPAGKVASIDVVGAIPTEGANHAVAMQVTYADGTTDDAVVTLTYGPASDVYAPAGKDIETDQGTQPSAADAVANKDDLPKGTVYVWEQPIDVSKPGTVSGTVIVVYPDGSTDKVDVDVQVNEVKAPGTDADANEPVVEPEKIKPGETPDLTDNVTNLPDLPVGTTVDDVTPDGTIDTNTPGDYEGVIEVTYPDGSKDTVKVPVTVLDSDQGGDDGTGDGQGGTGTGADGTGDGGNSGTGAAYGGNGSGNGANANGNVVGGSNVNVHNANGVSAPQASASHMPKTGDDLALGAAIAGGVAAVAAGALATLRRLRKRVIRHDISE